MNQRQILEVTAILLMFVIASCVQQITGQTRQTISPPLINPNGTGQPMPVKLAVPIHPKEDLPQTIPSVIYVTKQLADRIDTEFTIRSVEFAWCLKGEEYKGGLLINQFIGGYFNASPTSVEQTPCASTGAGVIHSHAHGSCQLSTKDMTHIGNRGLVVGVVCDPHTYSFYTTASPNQTIPIIEVTTDSNGAVTSETDITPSTPCNHLQQYCIGKCYSGCDENYEPVCTSNGTICRRVS